MKAVYLLKFRTEYGTESIWPDAFMTLQDAVRFGMRGYRKWKEIQSFKTERLDIRPKRVCKWF